MCMHMYMAMCMCMDMDMTCACVSGAATNKFAAVCWLARRAIANRAYPIDMCRPRVGDMPSALAARAECADDAVQTPLQRLPLARVVHPEAAGVGAERRTIVHADAVLQQQ